MAADRPYLTSDLVSAYVAAKHEVIAAGYIDEIAWQQHARLIDLDPTTFTREAAWVVLSAGMSTRIVQQRFPQLGAALHQWDPEAIVADPDAADRAFTLFAHPSKIQAICTIAGAAARLGTAGLLAALDQDPRGFLTTLPYIGPVTWAHLAKNVGVATVKADRHLERLSRACHRAAPHELCEEIASWLDEPMPVVDVVLWRYATLHQGRCVEQGCLGVPHRFPS